MAKLKRVCVFCGASAGKKSAYTELAKELGKELALRDIELVFGAGNCGLMGVLADSVLENGGRAIGVIPEGFTAEVCHKGLTKTIYTRDMAERKAVMEELADAFIALAGGIGTLDEIFQTMTLHQLSFLKKPSAFLNTEHFYDKLLEFLDFANKEGFIPDFTIESLVLANNPKEALDLLEESVFL